MITLLATTKTTQIENTPRGPFEARYIRKFSHVTTKGVNYASLLSQTWLNGQLVNSWSQGEGDVEFIAHFENDHNFRFPFTDKALATTEKAAYEAGQF